MSAPASGLRAEARAKMKYAGKSRRVYRVELWRKDVQLESSQLHVIHTAYDARIFTQHHTVSPSPNSTKKNSCQPTIRASDGAAPCQYLQDAATASHGHANFLNQNSRINPTKSNAAPFTV